MGIKAAVDRLLSLALVTMMSMLVMTVVWQVISRYFLPEPSTITDEIARFLLIWVALFGAAYVAGQGQHLAIDLLSERLPMHRQVGLNIGIWLLVALFALLVMVLGGARLMQITLTLGQNSAALHLPLGYVYSALPASGVLILFYAAWHIQNLRRGAN